MLRTWIDAFLLMPEWMLWATTARLAILTGAVVFLAHRQQQHRVAAVAFFLGATGTMSSLAISVLMTWSTWAVQPVGAVLLLAWVPVASLIVARLTRRWYAGLSGLDLRFGLGTILGTSSSAHSMARGPGGPSLPS